MASKNLLRQYKSHIGTNLKSPVDFQCLRLNDIGPLSHALSCILLKLVTYFILQTSEKNRNT